MITAWFRRARQTRTPVHSTSEAQRYNARAMLGAYRTLGALQIGAQLVLWITFYAYDQTVQTTWQAAVMLLVPLAALWALWNAGAPAMQTRAGALIGLALLPCLMADAAFLLRVIAGHIQQLIPEYPLRADEIVPAALCLLTVVFSRRNGVAYGAVALRWLLAVLFLLSTVFLSANGVGARLWPFWGQGISKTALTALSGAGSLWGVGLLFVLPPCGMPGAPKRRPLSGDAPRSAFWAVLPWLAGVLWALWYALVRPWQSGDVLTIGERLTGLARHSSSIVLFELSSLMWLIWLPLALAGCVTSGDKLLRAALPKLPCPVASLIVLLPGTIASLLWPDGLLGALRLVLPWRAALSLLAGVGMLIAAKRMGKGGSAA